MRGAAPKFIRKQIAAIGTLVRPIRELRFPGPMFVKEMLELARRRQYYMLRTLLCWIVFVVAIVIYWNTNAYGTPDLKLTPRFATNVFVGWIWSQASFLALITPTLVCGLVAGERDKQSFDILLTTDLSSAEILWGKIISRLAIVCLMLASSVPVLVMLMMFGGVQFDQILYATLLTISVTAAIASWGTYFSMVTSRPWVAMLRTYFVGFLLWFVLTIAFIFFLEYLYLRLLNRPGMPPIWVFWFLAISNPLFDLALMTFPGGPPIPYPRACLYTSIFWSLVAVFFFVLCCIRLRSVTVTRKPPITWRILSGLVGLFRAFRTILYRSSSIIRGLERLSRFLFRGVLRGLYEPLLETNPILRRNLTSNIYDSERHVATLQFLGFLLTIGTFFLYGYEAQRHHGWSGIFTNAAICQMIGINLLLASLAAGAIAREKERGTLDLLLLTELRPAQIIFGSFQGVVAVVSPTFFVMLLTVFCAVATNAYSPDFAVTIFLILVSASLAIGANAILVSIAAPNTSTAIVASFGMPILLWFGYGATRYFNYPVWVLCGILTILFTCGAILASMNRSRLKLGAAIAIGASLPVLATTVALVKLSPTLDALRWESRLVNNLGHWLFSIPGYGQGISRWSYDVQFGQRVQYSPDTASSAFILGMVISALGSLLLATWLFGLWLDRPRSEKVHFDLSPRAFFRRRSADGRQRAALPQPL